VRVVVRVVARVVVRIVEREQIKIVPPRLSLSCFVPLLLEVSESRSRQQRADSIQQTADIR
jgi:hypothetical protein